MPKPTCIVDDCTNGVTARGLCKRHYYAMQRAGKLGEFPKAEPPPRREAEPCIVDGCNIESFARKMCKPHYRKDYYQRNKERENASNKAYREANPEYWKSRWKKFYAENRDELVARNRDYYWSNPEARRAAAAEYRERNPGMSDRWRKNNPELWSMRNRENNRRRSRGPDGPVSYSAIIERDGMVCHICGDDIPDMSDLHFDHVIPLSKGGAHSYDNIKPSHASCNLRKGAKILPAA